MSRKGSKLTNSVSKISRNFTSWALFSLYFLSWHFTLAISQNSAEPSFTQVDEIVTNAIKQKEFPGCQVLVLHKGQKILDRSYGFLTYDSLNEVTGETLYDLASVTKVAATTLMMMDLYEDKKIDLDEPISCYMEEFVGSNKESITIRQLMAHNGGLTSYLDFWNQAVEAQLLDCEKNKTCLVKGSVKDSVTHWIKESPMAKFRGKSRYRYSDLGFMVLHQLAERVADQKMEDYLTEHFYQPLGLECMQFNPSSKGIPLPNLAPTENDQKMRFEQVWGSVHDSNAALLGGISGHAGLFSNSSDLAILMTQLLKKSEESLFKPETLEEFNTPHFKYNRRALGWDKKHSRVSSRVSDSSFGHKGFTGTMVWADPEKELVFVFLSNRIYPDMNNRKLIQNRTRSRIQDVVYEAIDTADS